MSEYNTKEIMARNWVKNLSVAIVGMGYVGLPLARAFVNAGIPVTGIDIDPRKVHDLTAGRSYISHVSSAEVQSMLATDKFNATTHFGEGIAPRNTIIICVPTPLDAFRTPDLSYVIQTCKSIAKYINPGMLVVLESTTYPGTTREIVKPILEEVSCRRAGKDFRLAYSPEREDPGNREFMVTNTPKVVGGLTPECTLFASQLYGKITKVYKAPSLETAESSKMLENIYRAVNIALVNELKVLFDRMGVDIHEVIKASATKPFGFQPFYPGPGCGGHCLPIDPFYLSWKARQYGMYMHFIERAGEVNTMMPEFVVQKTIEGLNKAGRAVQGSKVLIVGVAYKPSVDDVRESPALPIMRRLRGLGAAVSYHDPLVPEMPSLRHFPEFEGECSHELTPGRIALVDVVVVVTNHSSIDFGMLNETSGPLLVDTRNSYPWTRKVIKA